MFGVILLFFPSLFVQHKGLLTFTIMDVESDWTKAGGCFILLP